MPNSIDMMIDSKDRAELIPEGYYRGGADILPAWLAGRLLRVVHLRGPLGYWIVHVRVWRLNQRVDEQVEHWGSTCSL